MNRGLYTAIAFCACLATVLGAMGWVSLIVLRLDRAEAEGRRQAALEENVRLALWRMDSTLTAFIARENSRPYFTYSAFYPARRSYSGMYADVPSGEALTPSPMLTEASPYIFLHFQFGPDGEITSPEVPREDLRGGAKTAAGMQEKIKASEAFLARFRGSVDPDSLAMALQREPAASSGPVQATEVAQLASQAPQQAMPQTQKNEQEYQARLQSLNQNVYLVQPQVDASWVSSVVLPGAMAPVWVGGELLLARRVTVGGEEYVQGCWLDWQAISRWLLEETKDLLPAAELQPVRSEWERSPARMLAALPASIVPGPFSAEEVRALSPIRISLVFAWACTLLAASAVAVLLFGAVSLSERRAAFVSAVTHELRTPLTTLRLYTEMLSGKMVPGEENRKRYLETLWEEAERLSHLVENVLAYARLEKNRHRAATETVKVVDILERSDQRLAERAKRAGMILVAEDCGGLDSSVRADVSAVERILQNLVDNACKYAASAADKRIHIETARAGKFLEIRVRDHGPGISKKDSRRIFQSFSKSAPEAAKSSPGIGLGLFLSRRLAKGMGGSLQVDQRIKDGACLILTLPVNG